MARILIVEDEPALQETLVYNLTHQGYEAAAVGDGAAAVKQAHTYQPDLVILDLMLPQLDGFEVCRILRRDSNVPILMLTARDDEFDRVMGLELGADDYLTKPFSMRELKARVKALLRRVRMDMESLETGSSGNSLSFDTLRIDTGRREVTLDGKPLALKPKEYELFLYLAQHKHQALSREKILEQVWGWDFSGGSRTVDVHISWLREKIEADPDNPARIVTVRGVGYLFEG